MRIFTAYIYKQLFKSLFIGFMVFTFVLLLNSLPQLMDLFLIKEATFFIVFKLVFYLVLSLLSITSPMSILFAVLFTYSHLSENREIIALRSAGIATAKYVFQAFLLAICASFFLLWMNLSAIPAIQAEFHRIYSQIAAKQTSIKFEEKTFTKIGDYRIYINEIGKKDNTLHGINIYRLGAEKLIVIASYGKTRIDPVEGITFILNDGILQRGPHNNDDSLTHFAFKNYTLTIPIEDRYKGPEFRALKELTGNELLYELNKSKNQGIPFAAIETEYHLRWVISFSVLVLVMLGVPIGILTHRGSRGLVFGLSLVIIGVYYFMLIGSITLSEKGTGIPAVYIMWAPNIITFIAGIFFMNRLLKK